MKEVKFTRPNLARHLAMMKYVDPLWNMKTIYTTRDYKIADVDETVSIENETYKVLSITEHKPNLYFFERYFALEGFDNMYEFRNEILRIYPELDTENGVLYMHVLGKVVGGVEDD